MARGYSKRFMREIADKCDSSLGVALGKRCIACGKSVREVAAHIGLSHSTVYSWFRGDTQVPPKHEKVVRELMATLPE